MSRNEIVATRTLLECVSPSGLRPGEEIVIAPRWKRHELRSWIANAKRRGEISEAYNWTEYGSQVGVIVSRLKPAPRHTVRRSLAAGSISVGLGFALWLIWESRFILLGIAGMALALFAATILFHFVLGSGSDCACVLHGHAH